ncbi:3-phosphoshikimate 1-carboxyvinyltransferase [Candidatus Latescibacterota bacterium]
METTSQKSLLYGNITIPASKSHTIRAVLIGALADGESIINEPLDSLDTRSAAQAARAFGAKVDTRRDYWIINGVGNEPRIPDNIIDVGNSGTSLYMIMGTASLVDGWTIITGDNQIRNRTAEPLSKALRGLGVDIFSTRGNGMAPIAVRGKMSGGKTSVAGISSQYVSSLLLSCPLAGGDSEIEITELNERPYVQMTLDWLDSQGISVDIDEQMTHIGIPGNQSFHSFSRTIPGDFSSASFPLCAGALAGGKVVINGLEIDDPQGDKKVIDILTDMGADIETGEKEIVVSGSSLKGIDIDMNEIPDALPVLAVTACFAEGRTVLHNVEQARMKETDRIAVMAAELSKLGADITELPDGLEIKGTGLKGGKVCGHGDHRIVMAMTVAGFAADGKITVDTAESADVTFPEFWKKMRALGGRIETAI